MWMVNRVGVRFAMDRSCITTFSLHSERLGAIEQTRKFPPKKQQKVLGLGSVIYYY